MPAYVAIVRRYHPQGYPRAYFAGCTKRVGAGRMTDICRHYHATEAAAEVCAATLTAARNSR